MQLRKWAGLVLLAGLAACGHEGQRWHGTLEQDGHSVEFETYYYPPGVGEKVFGGASGLAYRIVIDGKTVDMAGNHIPAEWYENKGSALEYSAEFWGELAEKFKAVDPGKEHGDEHHWIYNVMIDWRDTMSRPGHGQKQALTLSQPEVPGMSPAPTILLMGSRR